ncbi:MAG: hypothetical protein K8S16_12215 [Bacteroidales bacterium]|nr:hypothetical protein [Bacteroidales bacterium]
MKKHYLFISLLIVLSTMITGQTVQLQIDKKHFAEIKLSTDVGADNIPDGYYESKDTLYFILKAKDWDISKGDLKDFKTIRIDQSEVSSNLNRTFGYTDGSNKIKRVLLVFVRTSINITKQFEFLFEEYRSDVMAIPEQYWPYYIEFTQYYEKGKKLKEDQKYIASFEQLKYIISESEHAFEFERFANYNRVYDGFVPEVITAYQQGQSENLKNYKSNLGAMDRITAEELEQVRITKDSVILVSRIFEPYYRITEQTSKDLLLEHEKLINDYNEFYQATFETWKKSVLYVIEAGFYRNENKFEVYIELLAKLLVYTNHVSTITKYDSINISLVSVPEYEVPFLKEYLDLLETMEVENWKSEFITVLNLLNDEIKNNNRLISNQHLLNLRGLKTYESQPNYYIINGFNELVKGKFSAFRDNINKAIEKCSDKEMLYYLELWLFSDRFRSTNANPNQIDKINSGLDLEEKGLPNDALQQYVMANRLGESALPNFLIGRLKRDFYNDVFAAERYINDAIRAYPGFALARIYHIEAQIENKQYNEALSEIEAVLNMPSLSIWYIYFLKAQVLHNMGNYKGSLHIIQTFCQPLNANNFEQFILLGDVYLALKDCEKAKENYNNAGDIDPNSKTYEISMQNYIEKCNN